jgi:ribosome biogenesis GTPase
VALDDGEEVDCAISGRIANRQRSALCAGDRVEVTFGADGGARLAAVLPRRSALSRPGPARGGRHREQVIAANIDRVLVAVAAAEPSPRPGLIDRILVAAERGGAQGGVVVNKWDLRAPGTEGDAVEDLCATYENLGVPVFRCAASRAGDPGVEALRRAIEGETVVLVGPSGVGKSTLLNALAGEDRAETGPIADATRKGTHTTTLARLHALGPSTRVIDTPGIREFGLWQIDADALHAHFTDVTRFAESCRYRNCRHDREPDCAVRAAVERGELARTRYESYRRLWDELET